MLTTSKYRTARRPMRPTFLRSPIVAMPTETVQKTIGAIPILMSRKKPSPSGRIDCPSAGRR